MTYSVDDLVVAPVDGGDAVMALKAFERGDPVDEALQYFCVLNIQCTVLSGGKDRAQRAAMQGAW